MKNRSDALLLADFSCFVFSFVWPLYFFPDKSDLSTQIALGLTFGLIAIFTSRENRLTPLKDVLPLLESAYGPAKGAFNAFLALGLISFFNHSYMFSRYINIIALISIAVFILVSRRLIFGAFKIQRIDLGHMEDSPVECRSTLESFSNGARVYNVDFAGTQTRGIDHRFILLRDDPFSLLFSRFRFIEGQATIELLDPDGQLALPYFQRILKRTMDIIGSLALGCIAVPILLPTAFASAILNRENPFFAQPRLGREGRVFSIYKLKTFFGSPARVTRFGAVLRRSNIDELPQFWNILCGDMSFVGPRAETLERVAKMSGDDLIRNMMKPGLTGFWQISPFRNLPIRERIEYDVYYLLSCSALVDLIIIGLTPFYVFHNNREK